jgi:glycosyltransferase involved in cell wall biosynthesis
VNARLPGSGVSHLHAHFAHSPASVAFYASILSGLPFSFTAHAKDIYTTDPAQLREKIAHARFVVTCTEYNRRHLSRLSAGGAAPIHRIYHGIDTDLFNGSGREETPAPAPPFRILTVARLTAKKGIPTVLAALKILSRRGIDFRFTLIGDGLDRDAILAGIPRLGLEGSCRWIGTQPHDVVIGHYRKADLFVLGCEIADDGDRDGIPNVLFESMAMGVPVAATSVSAIPELVEPGATGLLAPPGRPEELADAMQTLLTDKGLRRRIIPAARERVLRDFDNRRLVGRLAAIYREALGRQPSDPPA